MIYQIMSFFKINEKIVVVNIPLYYFLKFFLNTYIYVFIGVIIFIISLNVYKHKLIEFIARF